MPHNTAKATKPIFFDGGAESGGQVPRQATATSAVLGQVCIGAAWKTVTEAYVCVAGTWKSVTEVQVCVGGAWKTLVA